MSEREDFLNQKVFSIFQGEINETANKVNNHQLLPHLFSCRYLSLSFSGDV